MKKFIVGIIVAAFIGVGTTGLAILIVSSSLPQLTKLQDYRPLLVTEVYDVHDKKIGEFSRERRVLLPFEQIPKHVVQAFVSAEDRKFFNHGGIDYIAILRAILTNIKEGRKAQGASTITQQVARSLLLSSEKTYTRKIKEVLLSYRIESHLTKEQILYLYLNQIYLGQGAHGIEMAAQSYFRKSARQLTVAEAAILAGLPQAPSRYSPTNKSESAKQRQLYVLDRMAAEGFITPEQAKTAAQTTVTFYMNEDYQDFAPYFLETLRQQLVKKLGEDKLLNDGLRIHTTLDLEKQKTAQEALQFHLRELDKRQGYRGPLDHKDDADDIAELLDEEKQHLFRQKTPVRVLQFDGSWKPPVAMTQLLSVGDVVKGAVTKVDDDKKVVHVKLPEKQGTIDFTTMKWARKPNPKTKLGSEPIEKPSQALTVGDIIQIKIVKLSTSKQSSPKTKPVVDNDVYELYLEQEPMVNAGLLSLDHKNQAVIAMVGGSNFEKSKLNRTYQAVRQTGSSFKPLVYAAAMDSGMTPATVIMDAPIVYQDEKLDKMKMDAEGKEEGGVWKPANYGSQFGGDILLRSALAQSKNIPTIRIMENTGVDKVALYAKRLDIFSPLNMDLSMSLGSSSVSLFEMTKAFSVFANGGKRVRPKVIREVKTFQGESLIKDMLLEDRFEEELTALREEIEERRKEYLESFETSGGYIVGAKAKTSSESGSEGHASQSTPAGLQQSISVSSTTVAEILEKARQWDPRFCKDPKIQKDSKRSPLFFDDPDQLISPQTAYLMVSLMEGVVNDPNGTGGKARAVGKPVAGKTGSTSDYFDAWFIGFSPTVSTGVWVGFDREQSMGIGATGGETALPIWVSYMKEALKNEETKSFPVPSGIVFANIDTDTGKLASARSRRTVRQAFREGQEPGSEKDASGSAPVREDDRDLLKEDLSGTAW